MAASKDARAAAAKKRATARAQGRTRSTMATPGNIQEAGVTSASVAKIVQQVIKQMTKSSKPKPKASSGKPKSTSASQAQRSVAETRSANQSYRDASVRAQQRKVDEQMAKDKKAREAAAKIKARAQQQGVSRASGGNIPRGQRKYN